MKVLATTLCNEYAFYFFLIMCFVRLIFFNNSIKQKQIDSFKYYDLEYFLTKSIVKKHKDPIIVKDTPAKNDLFEMGDIIDSIVRNIKNSSREDARIIGINGEWGSGKTTLINLALDKVNDKNKESFVVEEQGIFDMWAYGSKEAMLFALYDQIFGIYGIDGASEINKKKIKALLSVLVSASGVNFSPIFNHSANLYSVLDEEKSQIELFISKQDKRPIIFIDNIDRAESSTIEFLFRLLGTFLKIKGLIFILAYDKREIVKSLDDRIFNSDIFLDKIVTREIVISKPNNSVFHEKVLNIFNNVLLSYGIKNEELDCYRNFLDNLIGNIRNVRQVVLLINNAFSETFTNKSHNLLIKDVFIMNIIKELNLSLWEDIRDHKEYFVMDVRNSVVNSSFKESRKSYLDAFFKSHADYIPIISETFQILEEYTKGHLDPNFASSKTYDEVKFHAEKSINSTIYFDDYFVYGSAGVSKINDIVRIFVEELNASDNSKIHDNVLSLITQGKYFIRSFFVIFEGLLGNVSLEKIEPLAEEIISNFYSFDDSNLNLSTRSRVEVVIAKLVGSMNDHDIIKICNYLFNNLEYLIVADAVAYWLKAFKNQYNFNNDEIPNLDFAISEVNNLLDKCCNKIINDNINLYDSDIFHISNIWAIFRYFKPYDEANKDKRTLIGKYMKNCLNDSTVYRILSDIIHKTTRYGDKVVFRYSFNDEDFNQYFVNPESFKNILDNKEPKNPSEAFIHHLFYMYEAFKAIDNEEEKKSFKNYIELEYEFRFLL